MTTIIFATENQNKVKEIQQLVPENIIIRSLKDIDFPYELQETGDSLEENAIEKAQLVWENSNKMCFADDTGLEIDALNGEPGVYSARYAGPQRSDEDNMNKVLSQLKGVDQRNARFRTVIAFQQEGELKTFEGTCEGQIGYEKKGTHGFGYDPIFIPKGLNKTMAELTLDEKNKISHRAIAIRKFVDYLKAEL